MIEKCFLMMQLMLLPLWAMEIDTEREKERFKAWSAGATLTEHVFNRRLPHCAWRPLLKLLPCAAGPLLSHLPGRFALPWRPPWPCTALQLC